MAKGRFVSKGIGSNEQLARVSFAADYLFGRCIPHLDSAGRMTGNPTVIKAITCSLRQEITLRKVPALLDELARGTDHNGVPLVRWYSVNGQPVLEFPGFDSNQPGLRKEREAATRFPAPPRGWTYAGPTPELCGTHAGPTPAEVPQKVSEVKRSEEIPKGDSPQSFPQESVEKRREHMKAQLRAANQ